MTGVEAHLSLSINHRGYNSVCFRYILTTPNPANHINEWMYKWRVTTHYSERENNAQTHILHLIHSWRNIICILHEKTKTFSAGTHIVPRKIQCALHTPLPIEI